LAPYANAPAGQARHALALTALGVSLYSPAAHDVHPSTSLAEPVRSLNQPSGQLMFAHLSPPPMLKVPAAQERQSAGLAAAPAEEALPGKHVAGAH